VSSCSQGRDWIRHFYKPKPRIIDDEKGYVPPRVPSWYLHDDIDKTNNLFNRCVVWQVPVKLRCESIADVFTYVGRRLLLLLLTLSQSGS